MKMDLPILSMSDKELTDRLAIIDKQMNLLFDEKYSVEKEIVARFIRSG